MNLSVGITSLKPYWEILLQQIGIPFRIINGHNSIDENLIPILILTDENINKESLTNYIQNGGCILTEADIAEESLGIKSQNLFIKFIQSELNNIFNQNLICDVFKNWSVAKNSNHLKNQSGTNTTFIAEIGKGKIIVFPSEFSSLVIDSSIKRKNFYTEYGNLETNERVSEISKGAIYHLIKNALENLFHHRNLPFINLWQFPYGGKNIFSFRIDTDFGTQTQLNNLYSVCKANNIPATWFVETNSLDGHSASGTNIVSLYKNFEEQEIALHCYRHRVFNNFQDNFKNIKKGINILNKAGVIPVGFAAPFGEWNEELGKSLEELDFNYSSEFSYAYDCFPIYPFMQNSFSKVLQIPIHPLSFGRLKWGGHNDDGMLNYYLEIVEQKLALQEPIVLYTHPGEERLDILDKIFKKINSLNIPILTFEKFYKWWIKRNSLKWEAEIVDADIKIQGNSDENIFWIRTFYPNKEVYLAPLKSNNLKTRKIENSKLEIDFKISPNELRKTSSRMIRNDILFKYRKLKQ